MKFALRSCLKSPGFTAVALLTLALGVGANTAMFSILNQTVLRPPPYAEPERLVQLWEDTRGDGTGRNPASGGVARAWQEQSTLLQGIAVADRATANLTGTARPLRLSGLRVNPDYLHVLRLEPAQGRDFTNEDARSARDDTVILSYATWQTHFGGRSDLINTTIRLGERTRTVIGILPKDARLNLPADFLLPFDYGFLGWNRAFSGHSLMVVGRLKAGATVEQLRGELAAITDRIRPSFPDFKRKWGAMAVPLQEEMTGRIRPQMLLLFGATACVLLIACANLAGLLLARAVSREREMALRLALGATRGSIIRQLLSENLLLALAGGTLGVLFAQWGVAAFEAWRPDNLIPGPAVSVDATTLVFALGVSIFSGLVAALAPAWRLSRTPFDELKQGGRASAAGLHTGGRGALIAGQIALSLVLLVGTGLMLRSLIRLQAVPLGFESRGVLAADLSLETALTGSATRRTTYLNELIRRVQAVPGVESVAIASSLPLHGTTTERVSIEGSAVPDTLASLNFLSGEYLGTLGIPLRQGRAFTAADNQPTAPRTMLINTALAARYFGGENAVGRSMRLLGQTFEIVGVVGDVLLSGAEGEAVAQVYLPEAFGGGPNRTLAVRTSLPPLSLARSIEAAILAGAPDQPLSNVRTLETVVAQHGYLRRLTLALLGIFSGVAVTLAGVGLYGIIAFSVDRRTRELGIRSALGASRKNIVVLVVSAGLKLTLIGIATGLIVCWLLADFIAKFLYDTPSTDPLTLGSVTLALVATALIACLIPARRAARIDPTIALRAE